MWTFGTKVDPTRPACRCLVALPGVINPQLPQCLTIIDLADWGHWQLWGWCLVGIDPIEEPAVIEWVRLHPDA